jgi:neutral ceramidase
MNRKIKKTGLTAGIIILLLGIIYLVCTGKIDSTPYYECSYYKNSVAKTDSLAKAVSLTDDSLFAGFSKVSITPLLKGNEDNIAEGVFGEVPLAGYGARKGRPSTGVHDSIFVKAVTLKTGGHTLVFVSADLLIGASGGISCFFRLHTATPALEAGEADL